VKSGILLHYIMSEKDASIVHLLPVTSPDAD